MFTSYRNNGAVGRVQKKKAAKKEKKDVSSISGLNFAKNEDHKTRQGKGGVETTIFSCRW